jgi:hypothetical protein
MPWEICATGGFDGGVTVSTGYNEAGDVPESNAHRNGNSNLLAKKNARRPFVMTFGTSAPAAMRMAA